MAHGYQLETSSLWDNPILRRLRDNTEVHAMANRSTIEALQKAGLIAVAEEGEVVHPTVWRLADKRLLALTALKKTARKQFPLAEGLLPLACFCATSSVEQGSWASTYVQVGLMFFPQIGLPPAAPR
jgi:hypothetical protein